MKIVIVGLGNIGTWFVSVLGRFDEIFLYDIDSNKKKLYPHARFLSGFEELKKIKPDMVLNAVSIKETIPVFNKIIEYISSDCILADVVSIKREISLFYSRNTMRYVSLHPMFGPNFKNMKNLKDEEVILISESCEEGLLYFRTLFKHTGIKVRELTFREHDELMLHSLGVPYFMAFLFSSIEDNSDVPGASYSKYKELAAKVLSEDENLLCEVLFNMGVDDRFEIVYKKTNEIRDIILNKDYKNALRLLDKVKKRYIS